MNLNIVPFSEVEAAIATINSWQDQTKYNTAFHTHADITAKLPISTIAHRFPDLTVEHFSNWVPLVAASQHIQTLHILHLSKSLRDQLIGAYNIWMGAGILRPNILEDLHDLFPTRTARGMPVEKLFSGPEQWFLRLDFCSAKDGVNGMKPMESSLEVLTALATSKRVIGALKRAMEEEPRAPTKLFLVPYNPEMDTSKEFRVFVPPGAGRIAAISQYRWHGAFYLSDVEEARRVAKRIFKGALEIHARIVRHLKGMDGVEGISIRKKVDEEGLVFDIFEAENKEVQLLEVNPFGAMSGCGSCLFNWMEDAELMYGMRDEVEVRITM